MFEGGLDIALLVILGYFFLRGIFRGVVKEVVAVLGLFVAFWVASVYWPLGAEHLRAIFDLSGQRGITSFILIFMVVYFLISIISIFVDKIVKLTLSPLVSALLGALVGLLKGILVCGIIMSGAQMFLKPNDKFFTDSQVWPYIKPVTEQAKSWMPEALKLAMEAKKSLPTASRQQPAQTGGNEAEIPSAASLSLDSVDFAEIQRVLKSHPDLIAPAWREKLRNLSGPEALSKEDLRRFASDHPNLFSKISAPANPAGTAPSWSQPAAE